MDRTVSLPLLPDEFTITTLFTIREEKKCKNANGLCCFDKAKPVWLSKWCKIQHFEILFIFNIYSFIFTIYSFIFSICLFIFNICLFSFNICLFIFSICLFIFNICLFTFNICVYSVLVFIQVQHLCSLNYIYIQQLYSFKL